MPEYNIKVQFEQKTFSFLCSEDQDIISAAKMNGIKQIEIQNACKEIKDFPTNSLLFNTYVVD